MAEEKLVVITAPSGAGKTTIAKYLLRQFPLLDFSVSATTRAQRIEEMNGKDYYFITPQEFKKKIDHNEFVEWEEVYPGTFYGTLKSELERLWSNGRTALFDVDVKGAIHLKQKFPDKTLTIFIKPPSYESLVHRLRRRATETHEKIEERINKAGNELQHEPHFDVVIVNENLEKALIEAEDAVKKFMGS